MGQQTASTGGRVFRPGSLLHKGAAPVAGSEDPTPTFLDTLDQRRDDGWEHMLACTRLRSMQSIVLAIWSSSHIYWSNTGQNSRAAKMAPNARYSDSPRRRRGSSMIFRYPPEANPPACLERNVHVIEQDAPGPQTVALVFKHQKRALDEIRDFGPCRTASATPPVEIALHPVSHLPWCLIVVGDVCGKGVGQPKGQQLNY